MLSTHGCPYLLSVDIRLSTLQVTDGSFLYR